MVEATVLRSHADLDHAPRGDAVYVVHSGSGAYFPAMALLEAGSAQFLGEVYDDEGRQVVLRKAPARGAAAEASDPPGAKRTITIGAEFFVTALKDYRDWPMKWWREAVQNAVDAGATHVQLGSTENADGTFTIFCDDDGSGMDEPTILDKFLVLGGTTKIGAEGAAGGFGKAKELLLLPWISWRIHSRTTLVEGAGIDYTTTQVPARQGTRLEVVMPADKKTDGAVATAFVQRCFLPHVSFTIDGKVVKAALSGGDLLQSIPGKVDIFYLKSKAEQPDLYVRTKGLYMFSRYIGDVPGFLLAELTAPSVDILTANRDGFRDWYTGEQIDKLAERIAKDSRSSLKGGQLLKQKFKGTGKFKARERASDLLAHIGPTHTGRKGDVELSSGDVDALAAAVVEYKQRRDDEESGATGLPSRESAMALLDQKFLGPDQLENAIKQLVWEPDWYLVNEIETYKPDKKFFPATMTPMVNKLAKSWAELVRYVMMLLGSDSTFGVGFVFSEDTAAAAVQERDEEGRRESWVLLNPFRDVNKRTEIWRPTQEADLHWLFAAAIHECTHIADGISYHDESFATALTRNMGRCANGYRKIKAIVAGVKMRGGIEVD